MTSKERFQIELLKLIISYHNDRLLKSHEMLSVLKGIVTDADDAMVSAETDEEECFDGWMERQAS